MKLTSPELKHALFPTKKVQNLAVCREGVVDGILGHKGHSLL
jgi:hypothetical protein